MKVILLKELKGKGGEGDVIEVARGYANNYLLTQGYAIKASKGNLKQLEQRRNNIAKREEVRVANANELVEKLDDAKIQVTVQVGEEGQLFGSVTSSMIADAINSDFDIEIDKHRVELHKPIKAVGEYPVEISIYRNIKATVNVVVAGEQIKENPEDESAEVAEDAQASETAETSETAESTEEAGSAEEKAESVEPTEEASSEAEEKAEKETDNQQVSDENAAVEVADETVGQPVGDDEDEAESAFDTTVEKLEEEPDLPAAEEEPELPATEDDEADDSTVSE